MLKYDQGNKPSELAAPVGNTFRWLAEPSMKAGWGGAETPANLLNPPVQAWEIPATNDWSKAGTMRDAGDMPQHAGLVGARTALSSGSGTVADYAKAARSAGLEFIVFLEDSLVMDQANGTSW